MAAWTCRAWCLAVVLASSAVAQAQGEAANPAAPVVEPAPAVPAVTGAPGTLEVATGKPGAPVSVDGQALGTTPFRVDLPAGSHTVRVEPEGAPVAERAVVVQEGLVTKLEVEMASVASEPPPAAPRVNPLKVAWNVVTTVPWAWMATSVAVLGLAGWALLWPVTPGNLPASLRDVYKPDGQQWRLIQLSPLLLAGAAGLLAAVLFVVPSLPFQRWVPGADSAVAP